MSSEFSNSHNFAKDLFLYIPQEASDRFFKTRIEISQITLFQRIHILRPSTSGSGLQKCFLHKYYDIPTTSL